MPGRDLTVVRIPLRRAKHHFGAASARGSRPYNEDTDQAGIIDVPAFAKRAPQSVVRQKPGEAKAPEGALGDPQIFYFGIFDGHGGTQCSAYLRDGLHTYIEKASADFGLKSTLQRNRHTVVSRPLSSGTEDAEEPQDQAGAGDKPPRGESRAIQMERDLVSEYRSTIGGYYRRFNPPYFNLSDDKEPEICLESVLSYAFLRADLDFVRAQADRPDPDDPRVGDTPLNNDEILGSPSARAPVPGPSDMRFKGGSTASVALISTPTPTPFWHPDAHSTLVVAHVGDTRVLLCETATGQPHPLTSDHHPTTPTESRRLRRYAPAGSMVSGDSFGEERIAGLANSRAFGDIRSKRIGVSAEPELSRIDMRPAQYAFLVLTSDGVSATLTDQEIVDVVKEAPTPERAARAVVDYATEVSHDGDNATCQVIRLGGWARRSEGGLGSLGTKEIRDHRRAEALDPRRTKQ
ncbi:hypothetical protein GMORB2_0137 [Geosmithia morbida]|uniref:PPM-type phosphatase domain-containing protein n=1 Tax=Geosmithia morbida TaxID=1094350 RepID=A0A9P4Z2Q2_9HYPO|nr:uncharacterized protein GMORB2_0137 [Geosmithia morbida]KAF4126401.1 hypothetical protein GMORB2_0137 [Geosmithia morbida]